MQLFAGLLDPIGFKAFEKFIPRLIIKSFQILNTYPEYKVIDSVIFNFIIPICYTSEFDAKPLFINDSSQDYHLTFPITK